MPKLSLRAWLTMLSLYLAICNIAANDVNLYYYTGSTLQKFEQTTSYQISPLPDWLMQIRGRNMEDKRIDFDQTSRNNMLEIIMHRNGALIQQDLQTGFEYLYDFSSLESEKQPYSNKTGFLGYGLSLAPLDSLRLEANLRGYLRQEQDRYLASHQLRSRGLFGSLGGSYQVGDSIRSLRFNGYLDNKKLDWEQYRSVTAGLISGYTLGQARLDCLVNGNVRDENLYVLTDNSGMENSYKHYDTQLKTSLNTVLAIYLPLSDNLECRLENDYSLLNYRHKVNQTRNTGDYNNLAQSVLNWQLSDALSLHAAGTHNYYIKDLSFISNTRIIETRNASLGGSYTYSQGDSVLLDYTVELRRSLYPDTHHTLDNDFLNQIVNLGWIVYWKDRIRLANRTLYVRKDEIYIKEQLSSNNNTVNSLQWQPECDILVGDCIILQQHYQVRADYDDYYYNFVQGITDTFYRQLLMSYHVVYDNSPLAAKLNALPWAMIPYRSRNNSAWRIDAGYYREVNETYARSGKVYYSTDGFDLRQTVSLLLQKQFGPVICQVYPKYSWGGWKEYNLLVSTAWQLNQNSLLEIGCNPIGPETSQIDWRIYCSLNLQF